MASKTPAARSKLLRVNWQLATWQLAARTRRLAATKRLPATWQLAAGQLAARAKRLAAAAEGDDLLLFRRVAATL